MIQVKDKQNCCGCTACYSVCPTKAISMVADKEGFAYPDIDTEKCTGCGLCDTVCAFETRETKEVSKPLAYAAKHSSLNVLSQSTSGGVFTALSDYILRKNGVIYGAVFDKNFKVCHIRAEDINNRNRMRGSKYVQSDLVDIFSMVKEDLLAEKNVLFTGTPCQIDGLRSFLRKDYNNNLICCDLICYGVPSPKVWKSYIEYLEKINKSSMVLYKFRPKNWSWYAHNVLSVFENGKEFHSSAKSNLFRDLYYSRLIMRPSCHNCKYTNLARPSDMTIADCRGIDNVIPDFNAENGASLVLINTKKGAEIYEKIKENLISYEVDIEKLLQPPLKQPSQPNLHRTDFFKTFDKSGFEKAIFKVYGRLYFVKAYIKKLIKK